MLKKSLFIAAPALLFDQISKFILIDFIMAQPQRFVEVTPFFNLVMVWNYGVSFGMFRGQSLPYQPYLLSLLAVVICAFVLVWVRKTTNKREVVAGGLIVGGAISNVIDRFIYGAVADFLDFHLGNLHWPAFNFADSFICIGVFLLVIDSFFGKVKK